MVRNGRETICGGQKVGNGVDGERVWGVWGEKDGRKLGGRENGTEDKSGQKSGRKVRKGQGKVYEKIGSLKYKSLNIFILNCVHTLSTHIFLSVTSQQVLSLLHLYSQVLVL